MAAGSQRSQGLQRLILALELALVGVIFFVLVKAIISFFAPGSLWVNPPKTPLDITQSASRGAPIYTPKFTAFSREDIQAAPVEIGIDAPETSLNLTLVGRRAESDADRLELGSAIIETPDGAQSAYYVGDEIVRGVILKAVSQGFVTLSLGGKLERLSLKNDEPSVLQRPGGVPAEPLAPKIESTPTPTPAPRSPQSGMLSVQDFLKDHRLTREADESGGVLGYRIDQVNPGFDLSLVGLQSGDIVQKIGNSDLTRGQAQWARIISDMSEGRVSSVTVIRNGQPVTTQVEMP